MTWLEPLTEGVDLIAVPQAFGHTVTASYLVRGERAALIDAACPSALPHLAEALEGAGLGLKEIDYVFATHFHIDHTSAAGRILEENERARLVVHYAHYKVLGDPARVRRGAAPVFGRLVDLFEPLRPVPPDRVLRISGGEAFDLGGGPRLRTIHTPGHEADHIALYEESSRTLFPGEALCLYNPEELPALVPPGSGGLYDVHEARESMDLLAKLDVDRVCLPHLGVVEGDFRGYVSRNAEAVEGWLEEVKGMLDRGMNYPAILEECKKRILETAGYASVDELPEFFARYWFPTMPRLMVTGYMAYLLWRF